MRANTHSFPPARRLIVAGLVAAVASLAACSDATTAPRSSTPARTVDAPSSQLLMLGATLTIRLADTTGATLKEQGWVRVYWGGPNDTAKVVDGFAEDKNAATGVITFTVPKTNQYKVCFIRSWHYMPQADQFPICRLSSSTASKIDMGTVVGQKMPMYKMIAKDEFGALAPGAKYQITHPASGFQTTVADGTFQYDESTGLDGITLYTEPYLYPGETICEIIPPPKMVLTSAACFTVPNPVWGGFYTHTFTHEHLVY